ncbi:MAG: hypothetical protein KF744_01385 [Taibaiella sp.]|nr:hypothetical protein [Taibaiella sp.]
MKRYYIFSIIMLLALSVGAQQNETVKGNKKTRAAREGQVFVFPDNIKFSKNELNQRVEQKTKELTRLIHKIAEKNNTNYKAQVAEAMKLFNNNDKVLVSVTAKSKSALETMPVRQYLERLGKLKYDNVNITWHNAQYVSNFTRQPDGTYRGIVAFEQEFTGVRGGEAGYTYHDVTQKRIEVGVKVWDDKNAAAPGKAYMDVFLGNIGVTEE